MSSRTTRRQFLQTAGSGILGLALARGAQAARPRAGRLRELLVYVGTYTNGKSEGIYLYRLQLSSGELRRVGVTGPVVNPSYLALAHGGRYLYAVNEVTEFKGQKSGAVSAFAVDRRAGALRFLNQQPSHGGAPCYVTLAGTGRFVLVANYVGGNVAVLPVRDDGSLGEAVDVRQDQGASGVNPQRQEAPHAHCVVLDRADRHAYACDLGADKIMIYRFDARSGKLTPAPTPWAQVKPGAGPRHLVFHPRAGYAYVMNELAATVTVFAHDSAGGALREVQSVPTLPTDFQGANTSADIHVAPGGRFLYCSNRGHDHIAAFKVDARSGKLSLSAHEPTRGKTPRNFAIDPTGTFLLVANQDSDTITTFRLDPRTGKLSFTGHSADVPSPVCLKLVAPSA
ncbi:MAG TPA: lactonase family protein [Pyrinomonadaceae bacterium]|jgi:6-phosphogluconolactonase|nr:lactonase family protein [Pyrinomonadaceae bacterium]